ncbi:hypothetical protein NQ318_014700 [Aromia moschata]|uniref:Mago nashi n=2 Tax=Cerambycidae TaxID=34667 RepID=A0AAV8ZBY8_9CUCU|nr:hypothetical protein NQ318_014700 [Aromia moschata]
MTADFYIRYYVGHKGKFGHEFLEFEFRPDGKLRYANNSNYKNDTMIRKEVYVHQCVMEELKRIIIDSEIMQEDDSLWPPPDRIGRQELEIVIKDEHISFTTSKTGSLVDVSKKSGNSAAPPPLPPSIDNVCYTWVSYAPEGSNKTSFLLQGILPTVKPISITNAEHKENTM